MTLNQHLIISLTLNSSPCPKITSRRGEDGHSVLRGEVFPHFPVLVQTFVPTIMRAHTVSLSPCPLRKLSLTHCASLASASLNVNIINYSRVFYGSDYGGSRRENLFVSLDAAFRGQAPDLQRDPYSYVWI